MKMKKIVILVLSFLFLNCEEDIIVIVQCDQMRRSADAQPVQLWPVDCETYNEKEVCGVFASCFCQPFECDDEIKVQIYDDSGDSFVLRIVDENDSTISDIVMEEISSNVHQASFIPSQYSPDVCDRKVQLKVVVDDASEQVFSFAAGAEGWTNQGAGTNWNWSSLNGGSMVVTNLGTTTRTLSKTGLTFEARPYRIYFRFLITAAGNSLTFTARGMDAFGILVEQDILTGITGTGEYQGYMDFTAEQAEVIIELQLFVTDNSGVPDATFYLLDVTIESTQNDEVIYKSDCLDIKTTHDCTKLISYTNNRVFNGLYFNTASPDETFYLRIPATFVHERFPEEDEVLKRTSDTITLNSTMEAQKLLETGYMPYYMHRKTKLVLKMQTVTIDDQQWVKQEAYEIQEGNKRHPKKMARVWLNEADFVQRNVL